MTRPQPSIAATVAILAMSAFVPARAQTTDDDAVKQVLRANGVALDVRSADVSECRGVPDARATRHAGNSTADDARKHSEQTSAALPSPVWKLYHGLGEVYAATGNARRAIRCFEQSLDLNPENEAGLASLMKLRNQDAIRRSSAQPGY